MQLDILTLVFTLPSIGGLDMLMLKLTGKALVCPIAPTLEREIETIRIIRTGVKL